ncbi:MAG: FtsX-like permease family protein [Desulfobulbaceae bacterium]|jgi:ABC-type lipoprotein release transport system permease subunit|nr:FtsX-like permease family protein [Desulfobulbaceae bacterium]
MFLRYGLKNILAAKKRTGVTLLLSICTTALLVFSTGFLQGSHMQMLKNGVEIYPGYLQISHRGYRQEPGLDHLIFGVDGVMGQLTDPEILIAARRFETFVLYNGEQKSVGGMFTGIEPEKEESISRLAQSLKEGVYLKKTDTNTVYMGYELARRLAVQVGDEVTFVGTGADYSFAADRLVVGGLFRTGLFDFDSQSAFVTLAYFNEIMAAENMATHIIVQPAHVEVAQSLSDRINIVLDDEYRSESWQETMAPLVKAMKVDSIFNYITLGIIFIVIFFVIMIYTFLTVYSRTREIGVLRAIGSTPNQVLALLLSESVILAGVSVVVGGIIGGALTYYFWQNPIMIGGYEEQFKLYGLAASAMPTLFSPYLILRDMGIMFLLCVGSTLYPIIKVNSLKPLEAIHHV